MKTRIRKVKACFVLFLSCMLCMSLFTAGAVFAEDSENDAAETAVSAAESVVDSSSESTVDSSAASTSESSAESTSESADEEDVSAPIDPAFQKILDALANPVYTETFEALNGGEKVTDGTGSDAAAGVQQTLADMGYEIEVDGNAGPKTFGTLNEALQEYGQDPLDTVDAAAYEDLLSLLLISQNEEGSYDELLEEYYDGKEGDARYQYLKGCAFFKSEHYYKALEAFSDSGFGDYEEKIKACEQPWPESGELWHNSEVYGQDMYLTFQVNSYDESEGMCFEVYMEDGTEAAVLFLTGSGSVTTKLPGGAYRIKDATGETWYGRKDAFGRYGQYEFMTFDEIESDEYLTQLDSGYEWTITINVEEGSDDATGVGAIYSDWEDWVS